MEIKAIRSECELNRCKKQYKESIDTLASERPSLYTEQFKQSIFNLADEIKFKGTVSHCTQIEQTQGLKIKQIIYYIEDNGHIKGMINCQASQKNYERTNKFLWKLSNNSSCQLLSIDQLSGICGGGKYLLKHVIKEAFDTEFRFVSLIPAASQCEQDKSVLTAYYIKIGQELNVPIIIIESTLYYCHPNNNSREQ